MLTPKRHLVDTCQLESWKPCWFWRIVRRKKRRQPIDLDQRFNHLHERVTKIPPLETRVNDKIRVSPIRVISADGEQLGVIPTKDALTQAQDLGLDLVEVAPGERPPVCRIMDYGKYKYEKGKKVNKSKSHQTKTKEIRVRPKTGEHDIDFKVKKAIGFLNHKDKVQVTVLFRGRELAHIEEGRKVMNGIIEKLLEAGKLESPPTQSNKRMIATISPLAK